MYNDYRDTILLAKFRYSGSILKYTRSVCKSPVLGFNQAFKKY